MIKFKGTMNGKPLYGFGLSAGNMKLLAEGNPIQIDLSEMGGNGYMLIMGGKTEEDIVAALQDGGLVSPDVKMHNQPKVQPGERPNEN